MSIFAWLKTLTQSNNQHTLVFNFLPHPLFTVHLLVSVGVLVLQNITVCITMLWYWTGV